MQELFEMIAKEFWKALVESDQNEFCKNKNNQRKPVLLSGRK